MGTSVSSANKTDHHDITEILLKVAFNIIIHNANPGKTIRRYENVFYVSFSLQHMFAKKHGLLSAIDKYLPLILCC
jgi:hypothetical protein